MSFVEKRAVRTLLAVAAIAAMVWLAYLNSLHNPFAFEGFAIGVVLQFHAHVPN